MLKEMEVLTSQGVSNINHAEKVDSLPASQFHEYLDSQFHDYIGPHGIIELHGDCFIPQHVP